jgi:hypothetical protein
MTIVRRILAALRSLVPRSDEPPAPRPYVAPDDGARIRGPR